MERRKLTLDRHLWYDILNIVSEWTLNHPDIHIEDLTDDIHDYILKEYGPQF